MKKIVLVLMCMFFIGCESIFGPEITCLNIEGCDYDFEITTEYYLDENNYYHFQLTGVYDEDTYGMVNVTSEPMVRIYWTSPDEFTVNHMGYPMVEPIIQHSTYTNDDGVGNQMFWIDYEAVGDTLTIYGSTNTTYQSCEWYDGPNDCSYTQENVTEKIMVIID